MERAKKGEFHLACVLGCANLAPPSLHVGMARCMLAGRPVLGVAFAKKEVNLDVGCGLLRAVFLLREGIRSLNSLLLCGVVDVEVRGRGTAVGSNTHDAAHDPVEVKHHCAKQCEGKAPRHTP